jgi:hypothetical protein
MTYRHALVTMIAYAFLQHRRLAATARKKRIDGPPPQPTLPAVRHAILELALRSNITAAMPALSKTDLQRAAA